MVTEACSTSSGSLCGPASWKQLLLFGEYCLCVWWFSCVYVMLYLFSHYQCLSDLSEDDMWVGAGAYVCRWRQRLTSGFGPRLLPTSLLWDQLSRCFGAQWSRLPGPRDPPIAFSPALGLQWWATTPDFVTCVLGMKLGFWYSHSKHLPSPSLHQFLTAVSGCLVIDPLSAISSLDWFMFQDLPVSSDCSLLHVISLFTPTYPYEVFHFR